MILKETYRITGILNVNYIITIVDEKTTKLQEIKHGLPHTFILLMTIIAFLVSINLMHPNVLTVEEMVAYITIPIITDIVYMVYNVIKK